MVRIIPEQDRNLDLTASELPSRSSNSPYQHLDSRTRVFNLANSLRTPAARYETGENASIHEIGDDMIAKRDKFDGAPLVGFELDNYRLLNELGFQHIPEVDFNQSHEDEIIMKREGLGTSVLS